MDEQSPIFWFDDHDISDAEMARLKEFVSEISERVRHQERSRCEGPIREAVEQERARCADVVRGRIAGDEYEYLVALNGIIADIERGG